MNNLKKTLARCKITEKQLISETGFAQGRLNHYAENRRQPRKDVAAIIVSALVKLGGKNLKLKDVFPEVAK